MALLRPRAAAAVEPAQAAAIGAALAGIHSSSDGTNAAHSDAELHTVVVDGRSIAVPPSACEAVVDLLQRFADGQAVVVGSTDSLLTTSQAAELIGVSATYLLRLANEGTIPVVYRGTHRRFELADAMTYLAERTARVAQTASAPHASAPDASTDAAAPAAAAAARAAATSASDTSV